MLPLLQVLRADAAFVWGSRSNGQQQDVEEDNGDSILPQFHVIDPGRTRVELCAALRPLLAPRLVARPRRKHALQPI